MLLVDVVEASREVAATRSRTTKTALLADLLRRAASQGPAAGASLDATGEADDDVLTTASYLAGTLRQRRTGLGWRSLSDLPPPVDEPTLTVAGTHRAFAQVAALAGAGSQAARSEAARALFGAATADEQTWLRGLALGELRQGALEGVLVSAIAAAAEVPVTTVRRATMLTGSVALTASLALRGGEAALAGVGLELFRPVQPMLAASSPDVAAPLSKIAETAAAGHAVAVDGKLDGIRVQVHRDGDRVAVYTRSLDDITERVPEVVEAALSLPAGSLVLDGEAIAFDPAGRPRPFQETGARTASRSDVEALRREVPLTPAFFDLLHLDGVDHLDTPGAERLALLDGLVPARWRVPRLVTTDPDAAQAFFEELVAGGHEGVVVKDLATPYEAGRRGAAWTKVKPRHTLDLVVIGVEWGSGRRRGWLSNLHLAALGPDGAPVMLGKTFKGLTDEMLTWQTERFLALETSRDGHVVHVRPEQVVEVAFDGVQRSARYPGGVALRFARVLRYRDDKRADEADSLDSVRRLGVLPGAGPA